MKYRYQFTSNVVRDSLSLELTDENWKPLAVVSRFDADHKLTMTLLTEELPFTEVEKLIRMAREELGSFEDGTPLPHPLELDDD
jgi:hypothetical protein